MPKKFYKNKKSDKIYWIDNPETKGEWLFSFDGKKIFNMFADYPHNLTPDQKKIFDEENPYWKNFFKDRNNEATAAKATMEEPSFWKYLTFDDEGITGIRADAPEKENDAFHAWQREQSELENQGVKV